jgi:DNA-binding NtrC family response regulator
MMDTDRSAQLEAPPQLLIIDDEPIIGKRLQHAFGKIGLNSLIFTSPQAALEAMSKESFNVVITDFRMKGMDGLEVFRQVKQLNQKTKVIIISGSASPETVDTAFQEGVFDFLVKPFRLDELKSSVSRAMEEISGETPPAA